MKSSFLAFLPLAGLAFAQEHCGPPEIVTKTEIQKVTVTVPATSAVAADGTTSPSVKPTRRPHTHRPHHSYRPVPHYPLPNGTYHNTSTLASYTTPLPTTIETLSFVLPSADPTGTSIQTLYVVPSPVDAAESSTDAATAPASSTAVAASSTTAAAGTSAVEASPSETVSTDAAAVSGKATTYGGNLDGGNCMFSGYTLPANTFGTAFSGQNWDASMCGVCVQVTGPTGKPVKAMVVDKCPECDPTHLDLFSNAYTAVSGQAPGIVPITYSVVPCGITTPLVLKNKSGTSPYWFSMQVMNANVGVARLDVSTDGGSSWKPTTRKDYNFFENASGFGTATVDVRVTSVDGGVVEVKNVKVASDAKTTAGGNFA